MDKNGIPLYGGMPFKKKKCVDCNNLCCGISLRCKSGSNKLKGILKEQKGLKKIFLYCM